VVDVDGEHGLEVRQKKKAPYWGPYPAEQGLSWRINAEGGRAGDGGADRQLPGG
jgi:hypothetical protein